ncbi:hypothetical protein WEH80_00110 [Actinomycetes bacterium KLBMP 9759]
MSALIVKGVNYDTGTAYQPGFDSRPDWSPATLRRDVHAIAHDLHCTAVTVFGDRIDRITAAAEQVLDAGLEVWVQPRCIDASPAAVLEQLGELAGRAEELRGRHPGRVTLSLGCELSIFMPGVVPGRTYVGRTRSVVRFWWVLFALYNRRLDTHLRAACATARERFAGPLTYGAGLWEAVDWTPFDLVGVNLYRTSANQARYRDEVRALHRHGKPVVITEFGCCAYPGAAAKGPTGDDVVDWNTAPPSIGGGHRRDERVQAEYLTELLDVFEAESVHGAFAFEFIEPSHPHFADPRHDIDMASFGLVAVPDGGGDWVPKAAFTVLAGRYA